MGVKLVDDSGFIAQLTGCRGNHRGLILGQRAAFTHIDDITHGGIGRPHEGDKGRGHKDKERYRAERAAGFPVGRCRERKQDGKDEAVYEPAESFKAYFPEHITRLLIFS